MRSNSAFVGDDIRFVSTRRHPRLCVLSAPHRPTVTEAFASRDPYYQSRSRYTGQCAVPPQEASSGNDGRPTKGVYKAVPASLMDLSAQPASPQVESGSPHHVPYNGVRAHDIEPPILVIFFLVD